MDHIWVILSPIHGCLILFHVFVIGNNVTVWSQGYMHCLSTLNAPLHGVSMVPEPPVGTWSPRDLPLSPGPSEDLVSSLHGLAAARKYFRKRRHWSIFSLCFCKTTLLYFLSFESLFSPMQMWFIFQCWRRAMNNVITPPIIYLAPGNHLWSEGDHSCLSSIQNPGNEHTSLLNMLISLRSQCRFQRMI